MLKHALTAGLMVLAVATFACGGTNTPAANQITVSPPPPTTSAVARVETLSPTPAPTPVATPAPTTTPTPTLPPTLAPARTLAPTAAPPTAKPVAVTNTCGAGANPWGYTFCAGSTIASPPSNFCSYFNCIASFWNGVGYVEQCVDSTFSKSGGRSGSCSSHGGNSRPLYGP